MRYQRAAPGVILVSMHSDSLRLLSYGLVPGVCLVCGAASGRHLDLCLPCEADLPWLLAGCPRCGLASAVPGAFCGACLSKPPAWQRFHAAFRYEKPIASLHSAFKFHQDLASGLLLAELLAGYLRAHHTLEFVAGTWIVPVPLHWRRHLRRGFNQAAVIARTLAQYLNLPVCAALRRRRHTEAQQHLDRAARRKNLTHAFQTVVGVRNLCILLVDDVLTTGATAENAARTLLEGGARQVDLCCLARTPNPV